MKINEEVQKTILSDTKETLIDMGSFSSEPETISTLLSALEKVLSLGRTEIIGLFASMCIEILDVEQFDGLCKTYEDRNRGVYIQNYFLYTAINSIQLK